MIVGDADEAVRASERALEKGIFAQAIRPPTVPAGSSRLRLDGDGLAHALRAARRRTRAGEMRDASGAQRAAPDLQVFDGLRDAA